MIRLLLFFPALVLLLSDRLEAQVFRCTNSLGKVEYTDAPCTGGAGRTVTVNQNVLPAQDVREKILKDENERLRAELEAARARKLFEDPATVGRTQADLQAEKSNSIECTRAKRSYEVAASSIQTDRNTDAEELAMYSACGMKPPDKTVVNITTVVVGRTNSATRITSCNRLGCVDERGNRYRAGTQGVYIGPGGTCTVVGLRLNCP